MKTRLAIMLLGVLVFGYATLRPTNNPATPSDAEARDGLSRLVELAKSGDLAGLCAIGDGNCRRTLDDVGAASVPATAPTILGTRVLAQTGNSVGGRVIEVCGIDGIGRAYHSETLVFRDGGGLRVINPIFWSGIMIAAGDSTARSPQDAAPVTCPHA